MEIFLYKEFVFVEFESTDFLIKIQTQASC